MSDQSSARGGIFGRDGRSPGSRTSHAAFHARSDSFSEDAGSPDHASPSRDQLGHSENGSAHAELDPEQQMQITNANKFTPSCARCRQKKLRCDTKLPCNQCTAKGIANECRKDQRVPRGRKRPKLDCAKPDDEISALKKRILELEKLVTERHSSSNASTHPFQDPHLLSSSSSQRNTTSGTSSIWPSGQSQGGQIGSRPNSPFTDTEDPPGETESSVALLEKLAASDPNVGEPGHGRSSTKKINDPRAGQISEDAPNVYFRAPSAFAERVEILEYAKQIIPERMIVDELVDTFNLRCHNLVGHVIHMPTLRVDIDFFSSATVADILTSHLDMFDLARYLMLLRLGMRFYPWRTGLFVDASRPEFIATDALKNRGDDISQKWYELAKRALAADRSFTLGSLKAVQAAMLMILDGRDSPSFLRMLLRISIQTALDMGLHRLGAAMPQPNEVGEDLIRIETGVRIWWYLVVKDWCSAQREGAYTIHPAQMSTRLPLHTMDDRLSQGITEELPSNEYTEMSYVLSQISLAHLVRESIDLRNEQSRYGGSYHDAMSSTNRKRMQVKIENFLSEDLPPFYRLDASRMSPGVLAVQRCLLHQQSFDILLRINRKDLASPYGRASLTMLAEQIVSTQKLLRSVCPVIDGFWINSYHLFGATLTLTVSLLLGDDLDEEKRSQRKAKIDTALATMRETPGSDRGSRIIETLLEEEEASWDRNRRGQARSASSEKNLTALTKRLLSQTSDIAPIMTASTDSGAPEESIVPVFCSPFGEDVEGLPVMLQEVMDAVEYRRPFRLYAHSLHPWTEPGSSDSATSSRPAAREAAQRREEPAGAPQQRPSHGPGTDAVSSISDGGSSNGTRLGTAGSGREGSSVRLPFHLIDERQPPVPQPLRTSWDHVGAHDAALHPRALAHAPPLQPQPSSTYQHSLLPGRDGFRAGPETHGRVPPHLYSYSPRGRAPDWPPHDHHRGHHHPHRPPFRQD